MTVPLNLDDLIRRHQAATVGPSLDNLIARHGPPAASTLDDLIERHQGFNHGTSRTWGEDPPWRRAADAIREGGEEAADALRHPLETVSGMAKSAVHDLGTMAAYSARAALGGSDESELTPEDLNTYGVAALNTTANAMLPGTGAGLGGRLATNAALGAINDQHEPLRGAAAGALLGEGIHQSIRAAHLGELSTPRAPTPKAATPTPLELASAGGHERFSGVPIPTRAIDALRTGYRSAFVTPYAEIEGVAPELAQALTRSGASTARAEHISTRRMGRVLNGLTDQQRSDFGTKLVYDNLVAEAERKGQAAADASDPMEAARLHTAAVNFASHADALRPHIAEGIEGEPWFRTALDRYKTQVEAPLSIDAVSSGVDPASLRLPKTAYTRLASEARLSDAEIRRAMEVAGVTDISQLTPRSPVVKALIGERPELANYFARGSTGPRHGPLAENAGYGGEPPVIGKQRVGITGSARMAEGSAANYVTDLSRVVDFDARDKATRSARNAVWSEVARIGRPLEIGEAPTPGNRVLAFDDQKALIGDHAGTNRYEVSPAIHSAVTHALLTPASPRSAAGRLLRAASDVATQAQISGMPVEATSHANTLASIVSKVPGEKDIVGKVLAAIPGQGAKAAAIREMATIDFDKPEVQALEDRLADVGALRVQSHHGGLIHSSSRWLFGQKGGVDLRGRLVLARKYLDRNPEATDEELRQFVVAKLGNYVPENSTELTNFAAKGSVLSPFARFQTARIPTAVKTTLGESGLPAKNAVQKVTDVANTLYRGPVGHAAGAGLLSRALSGHSQDENEPGHALDVNTGLAAVPGGIRRANGSEGEAPLYIPASTLDPLSYAGLRATGLRSLLFSPNQPTSSKGSEALRDLVNVGLGTAGPLLRGILTATTGTQPYLQSDNTMLRVIPHRFTGNEEIADKLKAAIGLANPAIKAFSGAGGDASQTLAGALAEDDKPFGGPSSVAARVAEFTFPRIASPSIGGRTNEQSVLSQLDRRYSEAVADYARRLRSAPGPVARLALLNEARDAARRAGYDPAVVVAALEKAQGTDQRAVHEKADARVQRSMEKRRLPP